MPLSLSPAEARKLVLNSQRVLKVERKGRSIEATMSAFNHLGYIQIDTISVVARAHHHTLWVRNPRYQPEHLDTLLANRKIFEYWSHAAAYLPMEDYRFSLPRMQLEKEGKGHWHVKNRKLMKAVLKRIQNEGPLSARDFEDTGGKRAVWERKPAKYALEQLFMEGAVMTTARRGFQKIYDLTERVLPDDVSTQCPNKAEYARFLIQRFLNAHGLGRIAEIAHLRQGFRSDIAEAAEEMLGADELQEVKSCGVTWLTNAQALSALEQRLPKAAVRILSPFDNLVILRNRIDTLFNFDYQIECYVPEQKRKYGYFSLPIVWQGKIVARMDCKAHRKEGLFEVRHLAIERNLTKKEEFLTALAKEVWRFVRFNVCESVSINHLTVDAKGSGNLKSLMTDEINRCAPD